MKLIPYQKELHHQICMELFESNVPDFFEMGEREIYLALLQELPCFYFMVLNDQEKIVGCGGYQFTEDKKQASLRWRMIHSDFHKQGFGGFLFRERLRKIANNPKVETVVMDTTQQSAPFYQQFGFQVDKIGKDKHGLGFMQYDLILKIENLKGI